MIVVEQQTWMTLVGCASFAVALAAYLASIKRDLKAEIGALRTETRSEFTSLRAETRSEFTSLRAEMKSELGRIETRLVSLENRTYDISTRLPAAAGGPATR